jgi:hypothetical protein
MNTVKREAVLKFCIEKEMCFFSVYESNGRTLMYDYQDEGGTSQDCHDQLEEFLDSVEEGYVCIKLSKRSKKDKSKGGDPEEKKNYEFRVRVGPEKSKSSSGIDSTVLELIKQNHELMLKIQLKDNEREREKLVDQIKELKENKGDHWSQYAPQVIGLLEKGLFGTGNQTVPVQGTPINGPDGPTRKEVIMESLNRLGKVDPDLAGTLKSLADFAEKSPDKYKMYLPMLKGM